MKAFFTSPVFLITAGIIIGGIIVYVNRATIFGNGNRSWCKGWDDCPATHHCNPNTGKCDPPSSRYTEQVVPDINSTGVRPSTSTQAGITIKK